MSFHNQLKEKVVSHDQALKELKAWREKNKKIIFTNGCFDIIHPGHIDYLSQARDLGDILVLGLNTDQSVRRLNKGSNRPINDERTRAYVLAGLASVDLIVFFDEETPYNLIKLLQPNVLVKGNDYEVEKIIGFDILKENGGEVITIPFLEGYSTSSLIKKIIEG
jgi:D-glycero-beta-D-manno-heptose 1-phosphate adenylyltransferase